MAKKKEYYIPKIEVTFMQTAALMWDLHTSNSMAEGQAPARISPVPERQEKAF